MIGGAIAGGFVGTLVLATVLQVASELRLTRVDVPFLLGTALSSHRDRAKAIGWALQTALGLVFSVVYWAIFEAIGVSGWGIGAALGLLHGIITGTILVNVLLPAVHPRMGSASTAAGSSPLLEPPGFLLLNYGTATPVVTVLAHVAYGTIVGGFAALSG